MSNITNRIFHPFKFSKYKQTFVELSENCKKGLNKFIEEEGIDEIETFEVYETIYNNSKVIIEYNSTITEYESLCRKYKIGVVEIVGNDCSISTMKFALSKKCEIEYANNVLTQFAYIQSHFTKGIYSFYHSTTRNYSFKDKEEIVNQAEFIKELDELVKTALYCESNYPAAWLEFDDNSLEKDFTVYSISHDKLRTINTSHFEIKNKFIIKSVDFSQAKINLIIGCASHDLSSFDESTIIEEKYFLDYISSCSIAKIENLSLECRFDEKNDFIRTIYYSSEYGGGVKFVDTYSYNSFYQLGKLIESCDTTFDDIYYFRKDNADAVKAYNKQYSGKESFFIEDFELIAKKDIGLIKFINDFNQEKKRKQEEERKKREEEEQNRKLQKAKELATNYPIGFKHYFPNLSSYSINHSNSQKIIWKEYDIKEYHNFHTRIKQALSNWDSVKGLPYYFFYYYYPTRFIDVSSTSDEARRMIWNFKDGISQSKVIDLIKSKITSTFSSSDICNFTFVCIPASTISDNICRYKNFSEKVCSTLNMRNAFDYINITKEKTPAHLSPTHTATPAEYSFNTSFFNGAKVILFDDVVTRGHSMQFFKETLESLGATIICAISIGRTYSDYFGDNRKPHPYTGCL